MTKYGVRGNPAFNLCKSVGIADASQPTLKRNLGSDGTMREIEEWLEETILKVKEYIQKLQSL